MILDEEEWAAFQQYINRKTITPQEMQCARDLKEYMKIRLQKRRDALLKIVPDLTYDQIVAIETLFSTIP